MDIFSSDVILHNSYPDDDDDDDDDDNDDDDSLNLMRQTHKTQKWNRV